jgi:hypothetical protein
MLENMDVDCLYMAMEDVTLENGKQTNEKALEFYFGHKADCIL